MSPSADGSFGRSPEGIETGNLSADLATDGQRRAGRVGMDSQQVERAAALKRLR